MKIVFAGTPSFALVSLRALIDAGMRPSLVFTQPDRPAGRGRGLRAGPVKEYAERAGLPLGQPAQAAELTGALERIQPDFLIVVAYGFILPAATLAVPARASINVHASLLPRWRGAAPIARAIEAGDRDSGVCIMKMDAGLDTGPVYARRACGIESNDTAESLEARLAGLGAELLVESLPKIARGELEPLAQPTAGVSYARKLRKEEAPVDWRQAAEVIARRLRAFIPWPVASTQRGGVRIRLWEAQALASGAGAPPGTVLAADRSGIAVQTGDGVLRITRLQAEGGKILAAGEFLNGHRLRPGERLGEGVASVRA